MIVIPKFSYRRIYRRSLEIFNATGKVVQLWIRTGSKEPSTYTPGQNLFTTNEDPTDASGYTTRYIKAKWDEHDIMNPSELGRQSIVKGTLIVPLLYVELLAQAEFVDPLLNGSRFTKRSAIVDEGRLFASVELESISLGNISQIVQ